MGTRNMTFTLSPIFPDYSSVFPVLCNPRVTDSKDQSLSQRRPMNCLWEPARPKTQKTHVRSRYHENKGSVSKNKVIVLNDLALQPNFVNVWIRNNCSHLENCLAPRGKNNWAAKSRNAMGVPYLNWPDWKF